MQRWMILLALGVTIDVVALTILLTHLGQPVGMAGIMIGLIGILITRSGVLGFRKSREAKLKA